MIHQNGLKFDAELESVISFLQVSLWLSLHFPVSLSLSQFLQVSLSPLSIQPIKRYHEPIGSSFSLIYYFCHFTVTCLLTRLLDWQAIVWLANMNKKIKGLITGTCLVGFIKGLMTPFLSHMNNIKRTSSIVTKIVGTSSCLLDTVLSNAFWKSMAILDSYACWIRFYCANAC